MEVNGTSVKYKVNIKSDVRDTVVEVGFIVNDFTIIKSEGKKPEEKNGSFRQIQSL